MINTVINRLLDNDFEVSEAIDKLVEGEAFDQKARKIAMMRGISLPRAKRLLMGAMNPQGSDQQPEG